MEKSEDKGKRTLTEADWHAIMVCPLFRALPVEMTRRLVAGSRLLLVEARQLIFTQGERAGPFYVVLEGWVKLYRMSPAGIEAVVGVFARGESFAEPVMLLGGQYPASAEAASAARLLVIDALGFETAMTDDPSLSVAMLASIVSHTDQLTEDIAGLKKLASAQRVADFLTRQFDSPNGSANLILPYDKALLAARLGMTPETLSRAFATLRRFGVEVRRERVSIADASVLRDYADVQVQGSGGESP